ncbi:MAG: ABC transporter permease, partial [Novosphingobium sp.]|nr:ABC transporter permease [Novosphingobium sp.]
MSGRLSTFAAALVVARRDFTAILFSRSFFFFLLGPLFPVIVATLAGGVGQHVQKAADQPLLGVAMSAQDNARMVAARKALIEFGAVGMPEIRVIAQAGPERPVDPAQLLAGEGAGVQAVLTGTIVQP